MSETNITYAVYVSYVAGYSEGQCSSPQYVGDDENMAIDALHGDDSGLIEKWLHGKKIETRNIFGDLV